MHYTYFQVESPYMRKIFLKDSSKDRPIQNANCIAHTDKLTLGFNSNHFSPPLQLDESSSLFDSGPTCCYTRNTKLFSDY